MGELVKYKGWGDEQVKNDEAKMAKGPGFGWKAKEGRNVIRFLPALAEWPSPFVIVVEHFINLPGNILVNFACPKALAGKFCPVCPRVSKLYESGSDRDKKLASKMRAKKQVYSHIIDRLSEKEEPDIELFKFGPQIWDFLKKIRKDPDFGDFTHPIDGFDIIINREGSDIQTNYNVYPGKSNTLDLDIVTKQPPQHKPLLLSADDIMEKITGTQSEDDSSNSDDEETASDIIDWE